MREFLQRLWYQRNALAYCLWPLSCLYRFVVLLRRTVYSFGWIKRAIFPVPVIVVGNLLVGGAGKTPTVIAVVQALKTKGYKPGIITRGYGGVSTHYPVSVDATDDAKKVGDEPLLLFETLNVPVVVDPKRVRGGHYLLQQYPECDCIVSDDGLQHYALQPSMSIVLVDARRRYGNGFCLPAGPLREPLSRLKQVDLVIEKGSNNPSDQPGLILQPEAFVSLAGGAVRPLSDFSGEKVHAVAGIGDPVSFFESLCALGLKVISHPYPDHHVFKASDLEFGDAFPIVMTEKDAVKCREFDLSSAYFLKIQPVLSKSAIEKVLLAVGRRTKGLTAPKL